jgi:hypothetical protein
MCAGRSARMVELTIATYRIEDRAELGRTLKCAERRG